LFKREQRGYVQLNPISRENPDQIVRRFPLRVHHRDFDEHVLAPCRDVAGLLFHLLLVIGEHFERNWTILNCGQQIEHEALIVGHSRSSHQSWIGGESLDVRLAVEIQHAGLVGPIGENLNAQVRHRLHADLLLWAWNG
jgi:hypothetical protein